MGFVVAATGLMTSSKSTTTVALLIPVVALGLPILDTTLATFRRLLRGRSPFSADQEHMHHKLLKMGLTHRRAVLVLWGFCGVACAAAAGAVFAQGNESFYILGGFGIFALVMARSLGYLRVEDWGAEFRNGRLVSRQTRHRRMRMKALLRMLPRSNDIPVLFHKLQHAHRLHRYDAAALELFSEPVRGNKEGEVWQRYSWQRNRGLLPAALPGEGHSEVSFGLVGKSGTIGRIVYRYHAGKARVTADEEALMLELHVGLADCLEQLLTRADNADYDALGATSDHAWVVDLKTDKPNVKSS